MGFGDEAVGGDQRPGQRRGDDQDEQGAGQEYAVGVSPLVQEEDVAQADPQVDDAASHKDGQEEEGVGAQALVAQAAGQDDAEAEGQAVDGDLGEEDQVDVEQEAAAGFHLRLHRP